jgi:hypothetical protein
VHALTLATSTSDNAAHGYNLTFAFPMILFIVIAGLLYLLYTRPHKVPGELALRATWAARAEGGAAKSEQAASADDGSGNVSQDEDLAATDGPGSDKPLTADSPSTDDREAGE